MEQPFKTDKDKIDKVGTPAKRVALIGIFGVSW